MNTENKKDDLLEKILQEANEPKSAGSEKDELIGDHEAGLDLKNEENDQGPEPNEIEKDSGKETEPSKEAERKEPGAQTEQAGVEVAIEVAIKTLRNLSRRKEERGQKKEQQQGLLYKFGFKKKDSMINEEYDEAVNDYERILEHVQSLTGKNEKQIEEEYLNKDIESIEKNLEDAEKKTENEKQNLSKERKSLSEKFSSLMKDKRTRLLIQAAIAGGLIAFPVAGVTLGVAGLGMGQFFLGHAILVGEIPALAGGLTTTAMGVAGGALISRLMRKARELTQDGGQQEEEQENPPETEEESPAPVITDQGEETRDIPRSSEIDWGAWATEEPPERGTINPTEGSGETEESEEDMKKAIIDSVKGGVISVNVTSLDNKGPNAFVLSQKSKEKLAAYRKLAEELGYTIGRFGEYDGWLGCVYANINPIAENRENEPVAEEAKEIKNKIVKLIEKFKEDDDQISRTGAPIFLDKLWQIKHGSTEGMYISNIDDKKMNNLVRQFSDGEISVNELYKSIFKL